MGTMIEPTDEKVAAALWELEGFSESGPGKLGDSVKKSKKALRKTHPEWALDNAKVRSGIEIALHKDLAHIESTYYKPEKRRIRVTFRNTTDGIVREVERPIGSKVHSAAKAALGDKSIVDTVQWGGHEVAEDATFSEMGIEDGGELTVTSVDFDPSKITLEYDEYSCHEGSYGWNPETCQTSTLRIAGCVERVWCLSTTVEYMV